MEEGEQKAKFTITETTKLSKQSKKDTKYSKISTEEELINETELENKNKTNDYISVNINPILIEKSNNFFYLKIGHTYSFFGDRNGDPLIMLGPNYILFIGFLSFISIIFICFFYTFWSHLLFIYKILGIIIYLLFFFSYSYTALINPGFPKHDLEGKTGEPRGKFRWCGACKIWISIEKKTNHCFDCGICVEGYDHHCPWTSKCIGRRNLISFYIFISCIFFIIFYLIIALINVDM